MNTQETKKYRAAMNLCTILHDALVRSEDSILTHPLTKAEIKEVMEEYL
tara:strand:+ start:866 stop:1012 length:147 start_codon:yes stop_codon:yes gene_type:complete